MFNLDPAKLLVIAIVAVILLGPDKLPQFARQVGGAWRSLNEFRHRMEADVRGHIPDLPSSSEIAHLARSPTALLNRLSTMGEKDGTAGSEGSNGNGAELPDGAPIEPFSAGTAAVSTPASTSTSASASSDDVTVFGDPSLN